MNLNRHLEQQAELKRKADIADRISSRVRHIPTQFSVEPAYKPQVVSNRQATASLLKRVRVVAEQKKLTTTQAAMIMAHDGDLTEKQFHAVMDSL